MNRITLIPALGIALILSAGMAEAKGFRVSVGGAGKTIAAAAAISGAKTATRAIAGTSGRPASLSQGSEAMQENLPDPGLLGQGLPGLDGAAGPAPGGMPAGLGIPGLGGMPGFGAARPAPASTANQQFAARPAPALAPPAPAAKAQFQCPPGRNAGGFCVLN